MGQGESTLTTGATFAIAHVPKPPKEGGPPPVSTPGEFNLGEASEEARKGLMDIGNALMKRKIGL